MFIMRFSGFVEIQVPHIKDLMSRSEDMYR